MIQERAMLAALHISVWTATRHDPSASDAVAREHGAHSDAGRYHKRLIARKGRGRAARAVPVTLPASNDPNGAPLTKEEVYYRIKTLAGQLRQEFYDMTLPWSDSGQRILPGELLAPLSAKLEAGEHQFRQFVRQFLSIYPDLIREQKTRLNKLYREEDFPSASEIERKFRLKLEILPLPSQDDFRVKLSDYQAERCKQEIDRNVRESLSRATMDLWTRLFEVVRHMATQLSREDIRLHHSVVDNIRNLVELLPHLNITGDPHLASLAAEVKAQLCGYSSQELKANPGLRQQTAEQAAAIVEQMSAFLGEALPLPDPPDFTPFVTPAVSAAIAPPAEPEIPPAPVPLPVLFPSLVSESSSVLEPAANVPFATALPARNPSRRIPVQISFL